MGGMVQPVGPETAAVVTASPRLGRAVIMRLVRHPGVWMECSTGGV